jgi:MarR family transcriptional regulator, organic hydroperoxide resistance regulator
MNRGEVDEEEITMSQEDVLKLENQVCFALYSCAKEMTKLYQPLLKPLGLTYTQYITMLVLWEHDRLNVKELGGRLFLDSGTLTPLLKKLESSGWIIRTRDNQDERSLLIELTEDGAALKDKAKDIPMQLFCRSGLSVEEALALRSRMQEVLCRIQRFQPVAGADLDG